MIARRVPVSWGPGIVVSCSRQHHGKNAALPQLRVDPQPSAVAVHDMLDDGQPQPGAAHGREVDD